MKSIKTGISLILLLISLPAFAQVSEVICKENYYMETALKELNAALAQKNNYSVSAPSNTISPGGYQTICVTVTSLN